LLTESGSGTKMIKNGIISKNRPHAKNDNGIGTKITE